MPMAKGAALNPLQNLQAYMSWLIHHPCVSEPIRFSYPVLTAINKTIGRVSGFGYPITVFFFFFNFQSQNFIFYFNHVNLLHL